MKKKQQLTKNEMLEKCIFTGLFKNCEKTKQFSSGWKRNAPLTRRAARIQCTSIARDPRSFSIEKTSSSITRRFSATDLNLTKIQHTCKRYFYLLQIWFLREEEKISENKKESSLSQVSLRSLSTDAASERKTSTEDPAFPSPQLPR